MIARSAARPWLVALVVAVISLPLYAALQYKRPQLVDFAVYRTAAVRALRAEPLYRPEDGHYQFKYLPAFAFVMAPATWVGTRVAEACWFMLTAGLLAWYLQFAVEALPERRRRAKPLVWLTVLVTAKFWVKELVFGQTNVLLAVLLAAALVAARRDRRALAGTLVGAAVIVKPYALLFVPWIAWTSGLSSLAAASAVLVAILLMPAIRYGWNGNIDQLVGWFRTVTDTTAPNLLDAENISIPTMWAKWIGPGAAASWLGVASVAALLTVAGVVIRAGRRLRESRYLELALLALLVPLISPQGWDYVLVIAIPAFACLLDRFNDMSLGWRATTLLGIALTSFTVFDLLGRHTYLWLMSVSGVTVGVLALVATVSHLRRQALA
jgi:glycosyl transferase family 87